VQRPYAWRTNLSKHLFRVPENKIRLITGDMGGSFGMKGSLYAEIPLTAWASKRIGRPVKWRCDRSEGFVADDHARDNVPCMMPSVSAAAVDICTYSGERMFGVRKL
jgi:carbon-monoxide dehydrogenase large subunit